MRDINSIIVRLAKRAEKLQKEHLIKSFDDVGPAYTLLSSTDNQIMFGRRGTGKTHFLGVLSNDIINQGMISVPIDMRLIGSTGGIFSDQNIPLSERATRLLSDTLCNIHETILDFIFGNDVWNTSDLALLLNDFIEQSTSLSIDGTSEEERALTNQYSRNFSTRTAFNTAALTATVDYSNSQQSGSAEKK